MEIAGHVFKLFRIFLPFFIELLFGSREEGQEAIKRNKMVVFLMGCLGVLFLFYYHNAYEFNRVVNANNQLGVQNAVLRSQVDTAKETIGRLRDDLHSERARPTCPAPAPASSTKPG